MRCARGSLVPHSVDGVAVIADGLRVFLTPHEQSRQREIDFPVRRLLVPNTVQMRARLCQAIIGQQCLRQMQTVLLVFRIIGERCAIAVGRNRRQIRLHCLLAAGEPSRGQRRFRVTMNIHQILRQRETRKDEK